MENTANKNQATIKTLGDSFVLTAGFKLETLNNLVKYGKGAALKLVDEKTESEYFVVSASKTPSMGQFGVSFTGANSDGFAEVTGHFPKPSMSKDEKKAYLRDNFALVLANLDNVQKQVEASSKDLDALMKSVNGAITIG